MLIHELIQYIWLNHRFFVVDRFREEVHRVFQIHSFCIRSTAFFSSRQTKPNLCRHVCKQSTSCASNHVNISLFSGKNKNQISNQRKVNSNDANKNQLLYYLMYVQYEPSSNRLCVCVSHLRCYLKSIVKPINFHWNPIFWIHFECNKLAKIWLNHRHYHLHHHCRHRHRHRHQFYHHWGGLTIFSAVYSPWFTFYLHTELIQINIDWNIERIHFQIQ